MIRFSRAALAFLAIPASTLVPVSATAQSISGTVQGAGAPIVGATVRLLELDRATRTGARGQFTFPDVPRGTYRVFAGAMGYAGATNTVELTGGTATTTFSLTASAIPLREVVISASPFSRTANEQYQSAESKSQVDFLNSAGASFAEKISDLPGVTVRSNGSAPARPILRGLGDNEVLVLENGLRNGDIATYDPAHATPIEALGVAQVDVVRGPATILYGPSTIGGLVNMITNMVPTVSDRAMSGTVSIEANSVSDQYGGYFNNVFSGGRQVFRISAGGFHAQDIHIPAGTYIDPESEKGFSLDRMPQSFDRSSEVGLGYAFQGASGSIGFGVKHFEMNYGIPGVPPNPDWIDVPPTTSRISQRRNTAEVRGVWAVGGSFIKQLKFDANFNDYNHSEFPTAQDSSGVSDEQANHFHKQSFNAVLQVQHQSAGKLRGTLGLWSNVEDLAIDGDQPLGPNSLTTGLAGYAYEEYLASQDTRWQLGLRYDYNNIQTRQNAESTDPVFQTLHVSRMSNAFTASFGAVRQFTPQLTGSFSLARSFRAPTVQELFANGLDAASGTYSIGTATLDPENGFGIDASLKGTFSRATFEVSPYLNVIDNYIYAFLRGDTIQDFPVRQFGATSARLAGFEASVTVQAADHFALRASADYVNAQDTKQDVPLPFIPPLRGLLRGTYQDDRYSAMAEFRMAADQSRLGDGDTPTAGYTIMNIGFGVRLVQQGVVHHISIHCDNVFNTVYRDNLSVVKDFIPQPARGFRLTYQLLY